MNRRGLTLLELLVVLVILIALATLVVPSIGFLGRSSQKLNTRENLLRLQDLLVNRYLADMGELPRPGARGLADGRPNHPQLRYLFVNPDDPAEQPLRAADATWLSARRWQGPYVTHSGARYRVDTDSDPVKDKGFTTAYGAGDAAAGDPTVLDAWGRPIVVQEPSTHGDFTPDATDRTYTRLVSAGPNGAINTPRDVLMPAAAQRGDDVVIFVFRNDEYGEGIPSLEP